MKMTFRWYGENDPVTLEKIEQIPAMSGIVSAVYDVAPGGVWSNESIQKIKSAAEAHHLEFEVVESVPVAEDIKLGTAKAPAMIDAYCENLRRLGKAGVKCSTGCAASWSIKTRMARIRWLTMMKPFAP